MEEMEDGTLQLCLQMSANNMIPYIRKAVWFVFLILIVSNASAFEIYSGNIEPMSAKVNIEISQSQIYVVSEYSFINQGDSDESVKLSFDGYSKKTDMTLNGKPFSGDLKLSSGERAKINLSYSLPLQETEYFMLASSFLMDDKVVDSRFSEFSVNVHVLNSKIVLKSNSIQFNENPNEAGRNYYYSAENIYPRLISFSIIDAALSDIQLHRTSSSVSRVGDTIEITSTISNDGEKRIENLEVQDTFLSSNFKPFDEGSFTFVGQNFEPFYLWKAKIDQLNPGEEKTFTYRLNVLNGVNLKLHPLQLFADGRLVISIPGEELSIEASPERSLADAPAGSNITRYWYPNLGFKLLSPKDVVDYPTTPGIEESKDEVKIKGISWLLFFIFIIIIAAIVIAFIIKRRYDSRSNKVWVIDKSNRERKDE